MDLWTPPHDAPHLLEWWRPLMLVSRAARAERFPWPVHLDEFRLTGRVRRQGRPDVWIYDHHENRGSICVDATGQTYKFVATPGAKAVGQFRACPLRTALWRARLPDVVAPVSYDPPAASLAAQYHPAEGEGAGSRSPGDRAGVGGSGHVGAPGGVAAGGGVDGDGGAGDGDGDGGDGRADRGGPVDPGEPDHVDPRGEGAPRVVRRGHLTLIAG